ncbi:MAG: TIGR04283 family arsenosugar biosynthesis glycosyltransferase [Acidobacteriota bacterium]
MTSRISVVIPVWREGVAIRDIVAALGDDAEIIVVDGDPGGSTIAHLDPDTAQVLIAPRGRASQMNAGAEIATGDILLFLHADTHLPDGAYEQVASTLDDEATDIGCFDLRLDDSSRLLALYSRFINLRTRTSRIPVGDQAIFTRREVFEQHGGFPDVPLLEEIILLRRLKRAKHRLQVLDGPVLASARRFLRDGRLRRILLNWWIVLLYYLGASPAWLRRLYWHDDLDSPAASTSPNDPTRGVDR